MANIAVIGAGQTGLLSADDPLRRGAIRGITLRPGDVIATGTPAGIGSRRVPPRALCAADIVEVDIESIGVLTDRVFEFGDRA